MTTNCKQGDIARVVCSVNVPNRDRIVTCIRIASPEELAAHHIVEVGPVWAVDRELVWDSLFDPVKLMPYAPDSCLRPIRGIDGDDETLSWAGLPAPIKQPELTT